MTIWQIGSHVHHISGLGGNRVIFCTRGRELRPCAVFRIVGKLGHPAPTVRRISHFEEIGPPRFPIRFPTSPPLLVHKFSEDCDDGRRIQASQNHGKVSWPSAGGALLFHINGWLLEGLLEI